jgi:hypothetical protein
MAAMIVLVAGAVAAGFYVLGSPAEQRLLRLDERRVADLNQIEAGLRAFWRRTGRLPATIDETMAPAVVRDPATGNEYEYRVTAERTVELCATFDRPSEPDSNVRTPPWRHAAGRQCFPVTVGRP